MITVTERAGAALLATIRRMEVEADQVFRLTLQETGFKLEVDRPSEDDRVIRVSDSPVLVIDGDLDGDLDDLVIDIYEGPEGNKLTVRPLA